MKDFKPSPELLKAAETTFLAMANVQTIRPIVEGYQREVLKRRQFKVRPEFKLRKHPRSGEITEPRNSYLMSDKDAKIYYSDLHKEIEKAGLMHWLEKYNYEVGFCPLLIAESLEIDAKRELINAAEYITGINYSKITKLEHFRKIEDLILKLCAPFINKDEVLKNIA